MDDGVFHNPIFERSRFVDWAPIGNEDNSWFQNRAVHVDTVDYLIV